jgi:hypothetical protein
LGVAVVLAQIVLQFAASSLRLNIKGICHE